jgi:hypothetical protein
MIGYGLKGLWVPAVNRYFLLCLLPAIVAIFIGRAVNRRLKDRRFILYIHAGLILVGATLLAQAVISRLSAT